MASLRFRYFVLEIFLILLALRNTNASANDHLQATKKIVVRGGREFTEVEGRSHTTEKMDGVPTPPEVKSGKIGGRKRMIEQRIISEESSSSNCNLKVVKGLKIKSKLSGKTSVRQGQGHVNVKMGTFMVFNSDYHVPKSHPPKNN